MTQQPLFHDDIREAIRTSVMALGGPKKVGWELWGVSMKTPEKAGEKLLQCIDPNHRLKLDLEDVQWISREAGKVGCHAINEYQSRDAGYRPGDWISQKAAITALEQTIANGLELLNSNLEQFNKLKGQC